MSAVYLAAAIVLEICGTTSPKLSAGFTRIRLAGAVVRESEGMLAAIGIVWLGESAGA